MKQQPSHSDCIWQPAHITVCCCWLPSWADLSELAVLWESSKRKHLKVLHWKNSTTHTWQLRVSWGRGSAQCDSQLHRRATTTAIQLLSRQHLVLSPSVYSQVSSLPCQKKLEVSPSVITHCFPNVSSGADQNQTDKLEGMEAHCLCKRSLWLLLMIY